MASPIYTYGDYAVTIATDPALGTKYAHFRAMDRTKTSYSSIPKTVTYQGKTYNVVVASALDGTISSYTTLAGCFQGCTNLVSSPTLPSGIDSLSYTFYGCQALATPPTIPSSVVYMDSAFYGCQSLASAPSIPARVTDMSQCFVNCQALTIPPAIPTGVTALDSCFSGCTSLRSGPTIPASVTYLSNCFSGCSSLAGNITINANVSNTYGIFRNTVKGIWLTGSSSKLQAYANTATNSNVFVGEIPLEYNLLTERVSASGATTPADEGTWTYLQLSITWANFTANNIDSISLADNTVAASITWYADVEKTTPISLPDWHPASSVTIYGWLQIDDAAHALTVAISDDYHAGGVIAITVPPVFRTIDFLAGGKGIAFGKTATQEGFECAMDVFIQPWAGVIQMFAGATAPAGWLFCDGSEVAAADYPLLYAVIGDTYGAASDASHFLLPDLRGRAPIGAGQGTRLSNRTLGEKVGAETHTLNVNQIPSHSHTAHYATATRGSGSTNTRLGPYSYTTYPDDHVQVGYTGGGQAHNNMQPSIGINFIICTGEPS